MKNLKVITKAEVYSLLIRMHKWTFEEVANLNPWQQLIAAEVNINSASDTLEFPDMTSYNKWKEHM